MPAGLAVLVAEQREPGPLEVGFRDVVGDAPCAGGLFALLERLECLVDQADLGEDAGRVEVPDGEVPDRRDGVVRNVAGLRHQGQCCRKVAEQQLEASAIVDRRDGEVGEAVRQGILVCPAQPHVAVVVPTEELVRQPQVEVQEAPGPRCDLGRQRHALQQFTGTLPLTDPPVQAGTLDHDQ